MNFLGQYALSNFNIKEAWKKLNKFATLYFVHLPFPSTKTSNLKKQTNKQTSEWIGFTQDL